MSLLLLAFGASAANADTFYLNYTTASASVTATIGATLISGTTYQANDITGTYNSAAITGLSSTFNGLTGLSNQFFSTSPYFGSNSQVDEIAFTVAGDPNVYLINLDTGGSLIERSSSCTSSCSAAATTSVTSFSLGTSPAPGPIPGTGWLSGLVFSLGGLLTVLRARLARTLTRFGRGGGPLRREAAIR